MIQSITIRDINNLPTTWANEVKFLKNRVNKKIEFTDGLNVIVGPNGSGKSTLLKMIAKYMHCQQGGISHITRTSIDDLVPYVFRSNDKFYDGAELEHDGQPMFYTGDTLVGISHGQFDDDFFSQGLESFIQQNNASSGQTTLYKINSLIKRLEVADIQGRDFVKCVNDVWQKRYHLSLKVIDNPTIPKGKKTILMDEPDVNLDFYHQLELFQLINYLRKDYQVILTAHSILSLMIPNVHVIETKKGYYKQTKKQLDNLFTNDIFNKS